MSETTDHMLNTMAEWTSDYANEVARLRDVVARARTLLDEGDPETVLRTIAMRDFRSNLDPGARDLIAVARVIREALAVLADVPPTEGTRP